MMNNPDALDDFCFPVNSIGVFFYVPLRYLNTTFRLQIYNIHALGTSGFSMQIVSFFISSFWTDTFLALP